MHEMRPPRRSELQSLSGDMVGFWRTQALCAAAELRIIEALPASTSQVAELRALAPDRCERLLRAMGELGLVTRGGDTWQATSRGALLNREHPLQMADAALHWGRDCYRPWEALPQALRAHGTWEAPRFFEELSKDSQRVASYHRAMASYARQDYAHIAEALHDVTHGTVLDAGGGSGVLLGNLLREQPELRGLLLERPEVARGVEVPAEFLGRMKVIAGDLFAPWSTQADTIILSRILHDWSDTDAACILQRAQEALAPGGRLHVIELVRGQEELGGSLLDLHMLVTTGGKERTEADFRTLLEMAGLRLVERRSLASVSQILVAGVP
ncbi:methyltransferase domain-containing protein [Archangium gephyra]|nr:methyltransferase domain-containing protein [Archangium gephyra]